MGPRGGGGRSRPRGRPFTGRVVRGRQPHAPVTHQAAPPDGRGDEDRIALFFQPGEALGDPI